MSIDGFVGGLNGELDWMEWNWGDDIKKYVSELHETVDTILLGRKMTDGFVSHWTNIVKNNPNDPSWPFAKKMVDYPKVVFSKTLDKSVWENTIVANDIVKGVNELKTNNGKDIIVYGGAGFVSSLIKNNLIDEYYFFVNPSSIGKGLSIFADQTKLKFVRSIPFDCGIVLMNYTPVK